MKKFFSLMLAIFATSLSATMFAGTPITKGELPKAAQSFITKYFSKDQVRKVEKENGYRGLEYDVDFTSGAEVDFNSEGNWKDIKAARGNSVPSTIIPAAISKYVASNYPGQTIVEISRRRGGYEVELSNGKELKLTEDAKPLQPGKGGKGKRH